MSLRKQEIRDGAPGTCIWLLENCDHQAWRREGGLLYLFGKPGSGKSTVMKFAVDEHNRESPPMSAGTLIISFFFHARGASLRSTTLEFFRSLLYQLSIQRKELLQDLILGFRHRGSTGNDTSAAWLSHKNMLRTHLKSCILHVLESSPLYLYIDALDECEEAERDDISQLLQEIRLESGAKSNPLGVCVSCRPYPNLIELSDYDICVDKNNSKDIVTCIRFQFRLTKMRTDNKDSLEETITDKASGVFQWVNLVLPRIIQMHKDGQGIKRMLHTIEVIPPELDVLYREMLEDINENELLLSLRLFSWICFAVRPLSLDELRFATTLDDALCYTSIEAYMAMEDVCEDAEQMERRMRTLSKGLIEVKEQGDHRVAQFVHQSVNDFMQRSGLDSLHQRLSQNLDPGKDLTGDAHDQLCKSCLRYLAMEEILRLGNEETDFRAAAQTYPFLGYATNCWYVHAEHAEGRQVSQTALLEHFGWPRADILDRWIRICNALDQGENYRPPDGTTLVHLSARYNLQSTMRRILANPEGMFGTKV